MSALFQFMSLFDIDRFQVFETSAGTIKARVGWGHDGRQVDYDPDEEVQDIEWDVQDSAYLDDVLEIIRLLIDEDLVDMDKITISPENLRQRLGWAPERFEPALFTLLGIRVDMVDDGERTDRFFVHF